MKRRLFLLTPLGLFLPRIATSRTRPPRFKMPDFVAFTNGKRQGVLFMLYRQQRSLTYGRGCGDRWLEELARFHDLAEIIDVALMREIYDAVLPGDKIIHPDQMPPKLVRRMLDVASS